MWLLVKVARGHKVIKLSDGLTLDLMSFSKSSNVDYHNFLSDKNVLIVRNNTRVICFLESAQQQCHPNSCQLINQLDGIATLLVVLCFPVLSAP